MWTLAQKPAFWPVQTDKLEDLGLSSALISDIVLRYIHRHGVTTLAGLSAALKLPIIALESLFTQLRQQQLLDVRGMKGNDYVFTLTSNGRAMAIERSTVCQYCGPAPVSLDMYCAATKMQAARLKVNRTIIQNAFSDLVLSDRLLDQLGPAVISQKSLFLYGPTGNGKTSVAERLLRLFKDLIVLPYAIEVDGNILTLFDPVVHRTADIDDSDLDPRWVVCERPSIIAGGELEPSMLELRFDEGSGTYIAPMQMKANNGIFIIDDFGRQLINPRDLLNRWIVPLDRRVDYLTLRYGLKFQIPFEMMVVFSTNLNPNDLADEAFLRRIPNKVLVDACSPALFDQIFERVTASRRMPAEPGSAAYFRELCMRNSQGLRACYVNDICEILQAIGQYENLPPRIDRASLQRAVEIYFAQADSEYKSEVNTAHRAM